MVKEVKFNGILYAIIVPSNYHKNGISFFTEDSLSQQLAYMEHPVGYVIEPHIHNMVKREIHYTREVLFIRKGKIRIDFYSDNKEYLESYYLEAGDVILLINGGHGFKIIEDIEMFEVKQGPYGGEMDKVRFSAVSELDIRISE